MSLSNEEKLYCWLICRFDDDRVHEILYGQFSNLQTPPLTGWVGCGKNSQSIASDTDDLESPQTSLDGRNFSLFGDSGSGGMSNDAVTLNAVMLRNDRDQLINQERYYVLQNSSIPNVNGRYMESGFHEGAPLYRNVREWAIVRTKYSALPELGISSILSGFANSELQYTQADQAFEDILSDMSGGIANGSFEFKKRFASLGRAGNQLISIDMSEKLDFINRQRAALRSESSASLLHSLQLTNFSQYNSAPQLHVNNTTGDATVTADFSEPRITMMLGDKSQSNFSFTNSLQSSSEIRNQDRGNGDKGRDVGKDVVEERIATASEIVSATATTPATSASNVKRTGSVLTNSAEENTELNIETEITMKHRVSYQPHHPTKNGGKKKNVDQNNSYKIGRDKSFPGIEAELAKGLDICIEEREAVLEELRVESARLHSEYLNEVAALTARSRHHHSSSEYIDKVRPLLEIMNKVRIQTLTCIEKFGKWRRLLHRQKTTIPPGGGDLGGTRISRNTTPTSYSVLIAYRSAQEMYAASEPVKSKLRKNCRDREPTKFAVDIKYVGVYDTKKEAIKAFDDAFNAIPQEYLLLSDLQAVDKKKVGMRKCGKHFWVHSSGVPMDLECELCLVEQRSAEKELGIPNSGIPINVSAVPAPALAAAPPAAASGTIALAEDAAVASTTQFVWNGHNYFGEKILSDTDFLSEVEYLQHALPGEKFLSNPLLLTSAALLELREYVHSGSDGRGEGDIGRNQAHHSSDWKFLTLTASSNGTSLQQLPVDKAELFQTTISNNSIESRLPTPLTNSFKLPQSPPHKDNKRQKNTLLPKLRLDLSQYIDLNAFPEHSSSQQHQQVETSTQEVIKGSGGGGGAAGNTGMLSHAQNRPFSSTMLSTSFSRENAATVNQINGNTANTIAVTDPHSRSDTSLCQRLVEALLILGPVDNMALNSESLAAAAEQAEQTYLATKKQHGRDKKASNMFSQDDAGSKNPNSKNASKMMEVYRFEQGGQMSLLQKRVPLAFRSEGVFCNSTEGELASLSKGRYARAFELKEKLFLEGKKNEEERLSIQKKIRAAVAVDVIECDVELINSLITMANRCKGSMLALDIAQAHRALRRFHIACKYAVRGQAWYRGQRDRNKVSAMLKDLLAKRRKLRTTKAESAALSKVWVPALLQTVVATRVHAECRSRFRFSVTLNGADYVVCLRRQASRATKPNASSSLCFSCNSLYTASIAAAGAGPVGSDKGNALPLNTRSPCTCVQTVTPEMWRLIFYDPFIMKEHLMIIPASEVQQVLKNIENISQSSKPDRLIMKPKFDLDGTPLKDEVSELHVTSVLKAAAASDMLLTAPQTLSQLSQGNIKSAVPAVLPAAVYHQGTEGSHSSSLTAIHAGEERINTTSTVSAAAVTTTTTTATTRATTRSTAGSTRSTVGVTDRQSWRPLLDWMRLQQEIKLSIELSENLKDPVARTEELVKTRQSEFLTAQALLEHDQIIYEDAAGARMRVLQQISAARQRIEDVMRFRKRLIQDVESVENGGGEDLRSSQAYANMEDANAWMGLEAHRSLEKVYDVLLGDYKEKQQRCNATHDLYIHSQNSLTAAELQRRKALLDISTVRRSIEVKKREFVQAETEIRSNTNTMLQAFSILLLKEHLVTSKVIGSVRAKLERLKDVFSSLVSTEKFPKDRISPHNRTALVLLKRRGMKLVPQHRTQSSHGVSHMRSVVNMRLDETTGNIFIQINGSSDFGTRHTTQNLEYKFNLTPEEVDWVLSSPVEAADRRLTSKNKLSNRRGSAATPDPNKLIRADKGDLAIVLPSKAKRALSTTLCAVPSSGDRQRHLKHSYKHRRSEYKAKQVERAEKLIPYLRLLEHTGLPCVGLLPFKRLMESVHATLKSSLWLSDVLCANPTMLNKCRIAPGILFNDEIVQIHYWCAPTHLHVEFLWPHPANASEIELDIPVNNIISSLMKTPLLLATFLWQFITNALSPQILRFIFDRIDWILPGQLSTQGWRDFFPGEIPQPHFPVAAATSTISAATAQKSEASACSSPAQSQALQYRGPLYKRHRFVSSTYFLAELFMSSRNDVRIALGPPMDGKFHNHSYQGNTLFLHLSWPEVRALLAKTSNVPNLFPTDFKGNLHILHHDSIHILFMVLLDLVQLDLDRDAPSSSSSNNISGTSRVSHSTEQLKSTLQSVSIIPSDVLSDGNNKSLTVAVGLAQLSDSLDLVFEKFNHWCDQRRPSGSAPKLSHEATQMMMLQLARQSLALNRIKDSGAEKRAPNAVHKPLQLYHTAAGEVSFTVHPARNPNNKQQMHVYTGVWSFLDLNKVCENLSSHSQDYSILNRLLRSHAQECCPSEVTSSASALVANKAAACDDGGRGFGAGAVAVNSSVAGMEERPRYFDSYMRYQGCLGSLTTVQILTNSSKTRLLVEVQSLDVHHPDAQPVLDFCENTLMAVEDDLAHAVRLHRLPSFRVAAAGTAVTEIRTEKIENVEKSITAHLNKSAVGLDVDHAQLVSARRSIKNSFTKSVRRLELNHAKKIAHLAHDHLVHSPASSDSSNSYDAKPRKPHTLHVLCALQPPTHLLSNPQLIHSVGNVNESIRKKQHSAELAVTPSNLRAVFSPQSSSSGQRSKSMSVSVLKTRDLPCDTGFRQSQWWYCAKRVRPAIKREVKHSVNNATGVTAVGVSTGCTLDLCSTIEADRALRGKRLLIPESFEKLQQQRLISPAPVSTHVPVAPASVPSPSVHVAAAGEVSGEVPSLITSPRYVVQEISALARGDVVCFTLHDLVASRPLEVHVTCVDQTQVRQQNLKDGAATSPTTDQATVAPAAAAASAASAGDGDGEVHGDHQDSEEMNRIIAHNTAEHKKLFSLYDEFASCLTAGWDSENSEIAHFESISKPHTTMRDKNNTKNSSLPAVKEKVGDEVLITRSSQYHSNTTKPHAISNSSTMPHKNSGLLGFYVPMDETKPVEQLWVSTAPKWQEIVLLNLEREMQKGIKLESHNVQSHLCWFGVLYQKKLLNLFQRTTRGGADSKQQLHQHQQAATNTSSKNRRVMHIIEHLECLFPPNPCEKYDLLDVFGDAVILLRHGTRDVQQLSVAFGEMQVQYEPTRALRLQQRGRERECALVEHDRYRQDIYGRAVPVLGPNELTSNVLLTTLPNLRTQRANVANFRNLSIFQSPHLLAHYYKVLNKLYINGGSKRPVFSREALHLMDPAVMVNADDVLNRFHGVGAHPIDIDRYLSSDSSGDTGSRGTGSGDTGSGDTGSGGTGGDGGVGTSTTVTQIMYSMLQLHCYNCKLPGNTCTMVGCCIIKGIAANYLGSGKPWRDQSAPYVGKLLKNGANNLVQDCGSGVHPLDVAIKEYLSGRNHTIAMNPLVKYNPVNPNSLFLEESTLESEIEKENKLDELEINKHATAMKLKIKSKELVDEARLFYVLSFLLVPPQLTRSVNANDILMAQGGLHAHLDQASMCCVYSKLLASHTEDDLLKMPENKQAVLRLFPSDVVGKRLQIEDKFDQLQVKFAPPERQCVLGLSGCNCCRADVSFSSRQMSSMRTKRNKKPSTTAKSSVSNVRTNDDANKDDKQSKTVSIPLAVLRAVTNSSAASFDPYPPVRNRMNGNGKFAHLQSKAKHNTRNATTENVMAKYMYDTLMERLYRSIEPTLEQGINQQTGDSRGKKNKLKFDRLLHEQVIILQDGCIAAVQFLYGVVFAASAALPSSSSNNGVGKSHNGTSSSKKLLADDEGCIQEQCASINENNKNNKNNKNNENTVRIRYGEVRFLGTDQIPLLSPGMTVVVCDILSSTTRTFTIEERSLSRTCDAFQVKTGDYGQLARRIADAGHRCIQLSRAGNFCTAVSFSVASLLNEAVPNTDVDVDADAGSNGKHHLHDDISDGLTPPTPPLQTHTPTHTNTDTHTHTQRKGQTVEKVFSECSVAGSISGNNNDGSKSYAVSMNEGPVRIAINPSNILSRVSALQSLIP